MIREIAQHDHDQVIDLNQGALHAVSPLDHEGLSLLLKMSDQAYVADRAGDVAGFVITLPPDATYDSSRFRWFAERYEDFVYLDRVIVSPDHQRQGVGSELYDQLPTDVPVGLEVYSDNDKSLAFHAEQGFRAVGELEHNGIVNVMMLRAAA
ncbi:GNAT family N-acetyltransferase [Nocardioides sp. GY 10113]|uniref:GNAT family N-acetyltransferase n=1 Tax=Nocardioides sp. GY 10113 TaxID=2569761 RepID=UPI0010A86A61|nr:GNAT family N-acetyltransferase [Nocardioides sp. GY 10113]TIC87433.1 GNAT family N-acetyltransferase [Nocardioides sp. GY 10113]